jgi:hypothetical protein
MGSGFNIARGIQFFTPILIALIAINYGALEWIIHRFNFCSECCNIYLTFLETKAIELENLEKALNMLIVT